MEIIGTKSSSLKGKTIVLAVTGSIAAVRAFDLCRELIRRSASVQIVATKAALGIVGEKSLEFASGKKIISQISGKVEHVFFFGEKGKADLLLIAPATANTISKIAMGIDDTIVTTFASIAIGSKKPVILCPAMHEPMFEHLIVKQNLEKLEKNQNLKIVLPLLAENKAKMQEIREICLEVEKALTIHSLKGRKILIASGATIQEIDPMRIISSKASGKTGTELAREAFRRNASVTLVHTGQKTESCINSIKAKTSQKMHNTILHELEKNFDAFICPAAISDFEVKKSGKKISSGKKILLELFPIQKLLQAVRKKFPDLFIAGFKAETNLSDQKLEKKAKEFLKKNKLDLVIANDIAKNPPGKNTNKILIVGLKKTIKANGTKQFLAQKILDSIEKKRQTTNH